jgi:hypothetical protein
MKALKVFIFSCWLFSSAVSFAQTSKAIEADLYKSFKRIDYWFEKGRGITFSDSLAKANEIFGKKLAYYCSKYPSTIGQDFTLLKKNYLNINVLPIVRTKMLGF